MDWSKQGKRKSPFQSKEHVFMSYWYEIDGCPVSIIHNCMFSVCFSWCHIHTHFFHATPRAIHSCGLLKAFTVIPEKKDTPEAQIYIHATNYHVLLNYELSTHKLTANIIHDIIQSHLTLEKGLDAKLQHFAARAC